LVFVFNMENMGLDEEVVIACEARRSLKEKCFSFCEIASLRSQLHFCLQCHYQKSRLITEHKDLSLNFELNPFRFINVMSIAAST
jgi:hypothetical protein